MTSLFEKFIPPSTAFVPRTAQDVFALRLAQKLNDAKAAAHYAMLAATYSESRLISAYRRTLRNIDDSDLGRRFQSEIKNAHEHFLGRSNLLAIREIVDAVVHGFI